MKRLIGFRSQLTAAVMAGSFALAAVPTAMADEVVALKNALYGAGYAIDNTNPKMGDATRKALEKFQKDNGLNASGTLDTSTKEALGMVSVQVAAAPASNSSGNKSASADSSSAAAKPQAQAKPEEPEEEEDDGGWSFF